MAAASALVGGVGWVVGDVGGALGWPGVLDQERDAADVDGAVAADGQLALSGGTDGLVPTHPAPGRWCAAEGLGLL